MTNSDITFEFTKKRTSDSRCRKAKTTSKKSSRKMTIYRKPRDMDIFKPVTTKLVYTDTVLLSSTGSVAFTTHTFRANSVFDPDWTGAGHQPTRFDQLAALYQRYEVLKSKIRVQFTTGQLADTSTTVALGPWHVGVVVADKQPQPEPERIQATPSQSPHERTMEHFVRQWLRRARRIGIVVLTASLSMTTPLRLLLALIQAVKDITSFGRSMRAMCQLLRCWLMSVLNMKCGSLDRSK